MCILSLFTNKVKTKNSPIIEVSQNFIKAIEMITYNQVRAFAPNANDPQSLTDAATYAMNQYQINTLRRARYFMAESAAETLGYTKFSENLYYSTPSRIAAVWPSRFNADGVGHGPLNAYDYIKNPEKLANEVYANRMGNGDSSSGDGWNYRGRGAGHLTGRENYAKASQAIYGDDRLVQDPSLLEQYPAAFLSFAWFWSVNGLNGLADQDAFTLCTQRINGASGATLTRVVNERLPYLSAANSSFIGDTNNA